MLKRRGYEIARVVDVCEVERNGKRSYKAGGKRITKELFNRLVWFSVDADSMFSGSVGLTTERCKTLYIPKYNNGGVLDQLDKETVKWS